MFDCHNFRHCFACVWLAFNKYEQSDYDKFIILKKLILAEISIAVAYPFLPLSGMFHTMAMAVFSIQTIELFPTAIRGLAVGSCYCIAYIGMLLQPLYDKSVRQ